MKPIFAFTFLFFLAMAQLHAQVKVSGVIRDQATGSPVTRANIYVQGQARGAVSDNLGHFRLNLEKGDYSLAISRVGYVTDTLRLLIAAETDKELGNIYLREATIGLAEVSIIASEASDRQTPVTVSTIEAGAIRQRLGDQPFPVIMQSTPGVYATRNGGGSGDASVNIRGFKQENVALLLNGVPIGSVENGLVYWNNWLGLAEATQQIQVQRGLAASPVALNSTGGTINIITRSIDAEPGGSISYSVTDYGNSKATLMLSSGRLRNNMAVTFLGSRFSGPGYVDATYVSGWAYYLSVSKEFNSRHMLVFTGLGNPERHGQRNFRLSQAEIDRYGLRYNKDWGSYNGKINNASENFYHKPHLSLNHYWTMNEKSFLATSFYISGGYGGGKWTDTFGGKPWIFSYYNPGGQIDWERIYDNNAGNTEVYTLANGQDTTGYSLNIQTNFLASHIWSGLLSTYHHQLSDHFKLTAGIHGRLFQSKLQQKVRDLLGGKFYIDEFSYAIEGVAGREQVRNVGDIVKVDNGATNHYAGAFGQLDYNAGQISAFLAGTLSGNWYRRTDRYNYVSDIHSEWVYKTGYDLKAGLNYNLSEQHNVYANGGYFSRAPYYKFVFGSFTNTPTEDLENEKTLAFEAGYGLLLKKTRFKVNAYYTLWKDKSVLTNEYNQFEDPAMVRGLDALHVGAEAELQQQVSTWLSAGGSLSLGSWKWKNDVTAFLFNDDNAVVDTIQVYANGLYVGDAPQSQISLFATARIMQKVSISAYWNYFDRFFADFSPNTRTDPNDRQQSYRIPSYQIVDLYVNCPFRLGKLEAEANLGLLNALNSKHIIRGQDGPGHAAADLTAFWGFGRNLFVSFRLNF